MNIDELEGEVLEPAELERLVDDKNEPMPNRVMAAEIILMRGILARACENLDLTVIVVEDLLNKFGDQIPSKPKQNIRKLIKVTNRNLGAFKEIVKS